MLRQIVDLAQHQLADRRRDLLDIEPKPEEEVVEVSGERGYTQVILRQPCADDCDDCPHGPNLHHVRPEHCPDGEDSLHWSFLGRVFDGSSDGARS